MPMKKQVNHKKNSEQTDSWLLPYADMLTLLLALFIVLFAMSHLDVKKYEKLTNIFKSEFSSNKLPLAVSEVDEEEHPSGEEESTTKDEATDHRLIITKQLQDMQAKINTYITENDLTDTLGTKLTDEGLLITLSTDFSFATGSAYVNEEGREIAYEIAKFLHTDPPHEIVISGHADDRPMYNEEFRSNWELSVMRAVNFMTILLENDALNPEKFSAKGYGEYKPIVPNTSRKNRAKNRRVEVLILPHTKTDVTEEKI